VAVAKRRQPERIVRSDVFLVADPHQRLIEEHHDAGQHLLAAEAGAGEVPGDGAADAGQRAAEPPQVFELLAVPPLAEPGVIEVLLSPAGIASGGLQVPVTMRTDPNVLPGGWNDELLNAGQHAGRADRLTARVHVLKRLARADAADAKLLVADIHQSRLAANRDGQGGGMTVDHSGQSQANRMPGGWHLAGSARQAEPTLRLLWAAVRR
jgi:hypothetical protein